MISSEIPFDGFYLYAYIQYEHSFFTYYLFGKSLGVMQKYFIPKSDPFYLLVTPFSYFSSTIQSRLRTLAGKRNTIPIRTKLCMFPPDESDVM